ncbi:MAG: class I SAM-dependent methyltransferase [Candidatus Sericytochromatia bacterium]|nr:class I SAM-dependent methyltransferase [Candidatus Sericytochromatia bacterium]
MNYKAFIQALHFRDLQPDQPVPPHLPLDFQMHNLILPDPSLLKQLSKLLNLKGMSSLAILALIQQGVEQMPPGSMYLNIGVWQGLSLCAGLLGNGGRPAVGVDNFSHGSADSKQALKRNLNRFAGPQTRFFVMDYERYFAERQRGPIGFYFYDGDHAYEHQLRALELAEPYLLSGSRILIDDTNWPEPRQATLDFLIQRPGQYQMLLDIQTFSDAHPTFWNGVMLFERL